MPVQIYGRTGSVSRFTSVGHGPTDSCRTAQLAVRGVSAAPVDGLAEARLRTVRQK
jgi:hypothetical protein